MAEGSTIDPQWHAVPSAELRFLGSNEGGASAVVGACIAIVAMFLAAGVIGASAFLWQRHRARNAPLVVDKVQVKTNGDNSGKQAWPDPEVGADKAAAQHADNLASDKLSASARLELCETLRSVLEEEISRGLKASGISDRLDRLEHQARDQQVLSGSLLPPVTKLGFKEDGSSTLKPQGWLSAPDAGTLKREPKEVMKRDAETLTEHCNATEGQQPHIGVAGQDSRGRADSGCSKVLTPSARQRGLADPPEKGWMPVDGDRSLKSSLATVSRNLARRDAQTQELHRQLRETQQDCVKQKLEATHAAKKLQDLLSNPTHAPQAQATELQILRGRVEALSTRLADSKSSEMQWCITAKRQRAFFMQSERVATEGVNIFRKHPAGELFLAPPPVYLEDDIDEDPRKPPWDIGTSHINPYTIDSWPFEPNVLAQKASAEPNLPRWEEEDGMVDSDDSEDADSREDYCGDRSDIHMRLPMLPPESPQSPSEEFLPPEPPGPPELLPTSARSL